MEMTLEELVVKKLMECGLHISFAESCTAGLCAARLVNVPSASAVFDSSVVTYANEAKVRLLGVSESTIEAFGVVSEEVAGEMAQGVANSEGAEVGVGISGIAGPTGATKDKPIGMVCFGFFVNGELTTRTVQFGELGRNNVRAAAVEFVYETLCDLLG